jgi:Escherichia/Staphylococcus phage prohead protease
VTDVHVAGEFYSAFPERRINPFKPEVRMTDGSGSNAHIVGYASVFNKLSRKLGGFVEKVNPRAFAVSKNDSWPDVVCRYNHNDDFLLGTTQAGTCLIDFDDTGLMYDVDPPSFRKDIVELCQRGDCRHSSFAFRVPEGGDDWGLSDFSYPLRTLLSVELVDVAPVITPAYPDATAATRAMDGAINSLSMRFQAEPAEIRSLLAENMGVRLFKRSDRPSVPVVTEPVSQEENTMTPDELRAAWYEAEVRAKYDAAAMKKAAASGAAMANEKGEPSYPIEDEEDLHNAIHAVGRGHASHEAIRQHIIARAKALGLSHMLPAAWMGDAAEANAVAEESEERADAPKAAPADTDDDADSEDDDDDDDDDDKANSGNGTENEGRNAEEESEDHVVANGEDELAKLGLHRRNLLAQLQNKRFDPYLDKKPLASVKGFLF